MKNTSLLRRVLSVVLTVALLCTLLVPAASAVKGEAKTVEELTLTPIDPGTLESQKLGQTETDSSIAQEAHAMTDVVRVSIELSKPGTLAAGFEANGIADNAAAKAYREGLRADQAAMTAKIEKAIGSKLDVQWNLTLAANFISANVLYGQIDAIKAIPGVKNVILENRYEPQKGETETDEPNNGSASYMIGSNITWANGYTGAGSKVAVIDTGADSEHQSFSGEGLEYALAQNAEAKGMSYDEYVATLNLLTPETIEAVKDQLNANIGSGEAAYRNTKIGYGYNYVDKNVSYIEHVNDTQGEHGSHVSGIATGNRFIEVDGEYKPALEAVGTQGVAPDAQLVVMKVFGKGGGAYDSDYMVAIEDAIILGCDSANLSLGSGSAGFSFSAGYEDVMNELVENGLVVAMSAGNSYGWYDTPYNSSMYAYLYMDDVNYATGGSPGSFTNSLTVASVDNLGQTGYPLLFGDLHVFYSETDYQQDKINTLAGGELEYVYFDNYGADGNGNSLFTPYADAIAGKVVLCSRGTSSFYQKVNAAAEAGAIACIIYNNQAGVINMNLTGITTKIPAVSILQSDGLAIKAQSEAVTAEDGTTYYTGTMSVGGEIEVQVPEVTDSVTVSSFSSYGMPGTLVLKPEILAPGGSIYSVNGLNNAGGGHDQYEVMSGTSMASPQVAGMAAVMGQYIRDNELCEKTGLTARQLTNSLLMSTAHPVFDSYGEYYPVFRVGAGLGKVSEATAAQSYILMDEDATIFPDSAKDGKVKAELGDDPDRTGEYTYKFTVNPLEGSKEFTLRTDMFVQDYAGNGGYGMLQYSGTTSISNVIGYFGMSDPGYEAWYEVNGETYENSYAIEADVNMDGETNAMDAQAILNYVAGELAEDAAFDEAAADVDGDGKITTYDAHLLLEAAATPTITADGPTEVTVHIKLTDTAKMILDYLYGATYIEGYTFVDPVADEEGVMDVVHSIPILAFYGSWTDAAMMDRTSVIDEAYGTGMRPYINNTNINYLTMKTPDGDTVVYMGNPYVVEDEFPADRLAMNSAATLQSFTYMPIRNSATQGFAILDQDGNVLYSQATASNKFAPYYYVNGGAWQNTGVSAYNVGKTLASAGLKEGDKASVGFYLLPEYYAVVNARNNDTVATAGGLDNAGFKAILESGIVGDGAAIKYDVTVDDTAPEVIGALQDLITGDIYVKAQDNYYIAYVAITNKSGSTVYFETVPEQKEPGEEIEVPLELEGVDLPKDVVLLVGDYAGNEVAFKVNLGGNGGEEETYAGQMFGFVPAGSTYGPGSGNRVWTIDPATANVTTSSYQGVENFANVNFTVTAAEYVDGYVFMAADDGWFYAAGIDELAEASLAGKYSDVVSGIYDMAYNYKNETMYVLGNNNTLYTMDLVTCELTPVCVLVLPGTSGSSMEANRLAIDDANNVYIGNYGGSSTAKLFKLTIEEPEEEEDPGELPEGVLYGWYFEDDASVANWTMIDGNGDGYTFTRGTGNAHTGDGQISNRWATPAPDDYAVTPAIDLSNATEATFSMWAKSRSSSAYKEYFEVYVGTSADPAEMTKVIEKTMAPLATYTNYTVDLSEYLGESEVYVAIHHLDSVDQYYLDIDDVEIQGEREEIEEPEEPEEPVEIPEVEPELVGVMGTPYNYSKGGAFAWDHNEGILYLVTNYNATNDTDHHLWTVNTETGKATKANNAGSLLRGSVRGLFIVPGRNPVIHPTDEAIDLIVEPEVLELLRGQSAELKVAVLPWTLTDKDVTFESADPAIASVKDGVVTGNEVGETVITVTTVAEPNLTAEVTVIVTLPPEAELRGVIWDENGKGQASVFNTNATADWEALSVVGQLRWGALVGDTVYGSTDDTMYAFDADTYEVTELGGIVSMWIPSDAEELPQDYRDAFAEMGYNVGPVIGPNNTGTYLTMLDPEAGSLIYFDFSDTFGSDPMALITYHHREDYTYIDWSSFSYVTDPDCVVYYIMTESGALYSMLLTHDGSAAPTKIADTGLDLTGVADATNSIWGSMKYVEETDFLYVALFNGGDYANLYAIDASDPTRMSCTGDFNESVWPVTGLYQYEPLTDLFLSVNPTEIELFESQTKEINVKIKMGETNEYEAEVEDPAICSFEDGVITGLKEGETNVVITTVDTNEAGEHLTETVHVTVKGLLALDLTVNGQVTDAKGARFTKILLDGPVAAPKGPEAPFDVKSGALVGDLYLAATDSEIVALNPGTFEAAETDYNPDPDGYFSTYPAMDIANYPYFTNEDGEYDTSKALFTTNLGWIVKPDYYGWNLSSYIPDMAGIAFGGVSEDGATYIYYILTTAGALYEIDVDYAAGSLSLGKLLDTGITCTDQSALSMAFAYGVNVHYTTDNEETYGLVVANNEDKTMWFIDFQNGDVGMVGTLDADNVSGLYGYYDDMVAVDEGPAPVSVPVGDVFQGFYFEEDPAEAGWTVNDDDNDGYTWTWNQNIASWFSGTPDFNSMAYEGTGCFMSGSYINTVGVLTPDNWAFSPAIDLSEAEGNLALTFWANSVDADYPENFAVYVMDLETEGMTQVLPETKTKAAYTMYSVDLNDFAGKTISIGFRNFNVTDQYLMALDQVEVLHNVEWTEGGTTPEPVEPGIEGNVLFSDSFEDGLDAWTLVDADGDGYSYETADASQFETPDIYDGDVMVMSASYINNVGALTPDNWMVSPAIDLSDAADDAIVSLFAKGQDPSYASENFAIYAGTSADTASMNKIGGDFTATGAWAQYTGSLAEFVGEEEVYIAIRHYNVTDMFYLDLDLVQVLDNLTEGEPEAHAVVNSGFNKAVESVNKNVPAKSYEARTLQVAQLGDGFARTAAAAAPAVVEMTKLGETANAVVGGTNAVKGEVVKTDLRMPVDETTVENNAVQIVLTEDVAVTNGLYTVTYDADKLTFVNATSNLELKAIHHEITEPAEGEEPALKLGVVTFAFADLKEIAAETPLLTLNFTYEGEAIETTVVVATLERNDDVAVEDESLVIEIKEGELPPEPPVDDEIYELTTELKDGDKVVIYNPAAGKALSNEAVATYYRAGKDVTPEDGKVINPAADLVWTVTAVEGGIELTDAEGHKLSIQDGKNNLPLDAENTVWEIQKGEGETVYVVSTTAIGSSGDHKAVEYYTKYSEFSAYYLTTTDEQFIMELYAKTEGGEEPPEPPVHDCQITHFTDVMEAYPDPENPYHQAIEWAFTHEPEQITSGMNETTFGVGGTLTRAQAATFLYAAAGKPEFDENTAENPFTDVKLGKWYTTPVLWAYSEGLVSGMSADTYGVNSNLTRGQILVILYAWAGKPSVEGLENPYTDVPADKWYTNAAIWAYNLGIEKGEDGVFAQSTPCYREVMVLYLYRYLEGKCLAE